jgi:hypothetical protein
LVEYKIEEIKVFVEKSNSVYDSLKCMDNNYVNQKGQKSIDFNEDTFKDYLQFLDNLRKFLESVHQVLFETKFDN